MKRLKELKQTHGKVETFEPTTLDQIWGDTGLSRYSTMNEIEYTNRLKEMNKSDLMSHAAEIGIVPNDDRERLTKKLVSEFKKYVSAYQKPIVPSIPDRIPSKEALKILSEGR